METIASTTLHCTANGSDKVYTVAIVKHGATGGYDVIAENGKRGGTQKAQPAKAVGVTEDYARQVYAAVIREKIAKKYNPLDGDATAVAARSERDGKSAGVPVMLLNPIDEAEIADLLSTASATPWIMQPKMDGERRLLIVRGDDVAGTNRKGAFVPLPPAIVAAAKHYGPDAILDGEQVGEVFHAFDTLRMNGEDLTSEACIDRYVRLAGRHAMLPEGACKSLALVPAFAANPQVLTVIDEMREAGAEGVVFKRRTAKYRDGRPSSRGDALKFKFYNTATVEVVDHNDVHSVRVATYANGVLTERGSVTIPPSMSLPAIGAFIEVRYRCAYRGGSLYQPTYLATRTDVGRDACDDAQLAFKGEGVAA